MMVNLALVSTINQRRIPSPVVFESRPSQDGETTQIWIVRRIIAASDVPGVCRMDSGHSRIANPQFHDANMPPAVSKVREIHFSFIFG